MNSSVAPRLYAIDSETLKAELALVEVADEYDYFPAPGSLKIKIITGVRVGDGSNRPVTIIKGQGPGTAHILVLPTDD